MNSGVSFPTLSHVLRARKDELLDAYDEWLYYERKLLHIERWGIERSEETLDLIPHTGAGSFHFPRLPERWQERPQPSTRAQLVLRTIGCKWKPGAP